MKRLIPLALALTLAAPAAFAGAPGKLAPVVDPVVAVPPPVPRVMVGDWTGPYVGATLGFGRARWEGDNVEVDEEGNVIETVREFFREGQFGVGGHVGYNADMGNFVVGGELAVVPGFNRVIGDREVSWGAVGRVRAGPKLGARGETWAFGSLGLAHAHHRAANVPEGEDADARSSTGWVVGVGASHMVADNVFVTGEINHTRFQGENRVRGTGVSLGVSFRF